MIEVIALRIWQEREMQFPPRVRRMKPDELDYISGAWRLVMEAASKELSEQRTHPEDHQL